MRDDDNDRAARLELAQRILQGGFALAVEIGVGLVEHDQERIAVERARERDALALSGGERGLPDRVS